MSATCMSKQLPLTMRQPITDKESKELKQPPTPKRFPLPSSSPAQRHTRIHTRAYVPRPAMQFAPQSQEIKSHLYSWLLFKEEGWSVSCAHHSVQPQGPGDSLAPPSASITQHHCDGHKSSLRISQENKVPLFIPPSLLSFPPGCVEKVNSSAEREEEWREDTTLHGCLQNQQCPFAHNCAHI